MRLHGPRGAWERARDRTPSISVAGAYVSRGRAVILHYRGKMDGFLTSCGGRGSMLIVCTECARLLIFEF